MILPKIIKFGSLYASKKEGYFGVATPIFLSMLSPFLGILTPEVAGDQPASALFATRPDSPVRVLRTLVSQCACRRYGESFSGSVVADYFPGSHCTSCPPYKLPVSARFAGIA